MFRILAPALLLFSATLYAEDASEDTLQLQRDLARLRAELTHANLTPSPENRYGPNVTTPTPNPTHALIQVWYTSLNSNTSDLFDEESESPGAPTATPPPDTKDEF